MSKLIVIRGPSGAGKSTVSQKVFKRSSRPTLLVSEDRMRKMFSDHHIAGHDAARELATESVLLGLRNGYDVIYEGILNIKTHRKQFEDIFATHPKENYFFYLEASFDETVKRHKTRPEKSEFTPKAMEKWWNYASPTGLPFETIIPETSSLEETIKTIGEVAKLKS